ncbi:PQQ-dependent sugar dehydrogenase [Pendulispora albinea]|uniref:PQQ-dependent sugar dehydrogenase n=1 Tax=Pendulispora albinea TaxID=2741071 RepID=A0ABZ2MCC2_9BACT
MRWLVLSASGLLALLGCSSTSSDSGTDPGGDEDIQGNELAAGNCTGTTPYTTAWVADPKLCVYVYASGLGAARQIAFAPNGDLFVSNGKVTVLWDDNKNGTSDSNEQGTFATASGLNHGLAFSPDFKFLYASSATTIYRWAYTGSRTATGPAQVVVRGIPSGGHSARTLVFDSRGRLYVNVGSSGNVDTTQQLWDTRAQVRRFAIPSTIPSGGINYTSGEVVAKGLRNENGLFVDAQDRLWGVENGRDNLTDPDTGDIHNDNPGEEINLLEDGGNRFYGYPFCYSEYKINGGGGAGTQWADQTLATSIRKTDTWCRDTNNVRRPKFVMQAHWAPLGLAQYTGSSLPYTNDFIIAIHGSWNRSPATGKLLARATYQNGEIVAVTPIVGEKNASGGLGQGQAGAPRPVDVRQGADGAVYYSDDDGGRIFKVGYRQ